MAYIYAPRLPQIRAGAVSWSLPLFEPTAKALLDALLLDEADSRYARLLEAVSRDPSITLWAVCTADASDARELRTLADTARWLLAAGIRQNLRWADDQLGSPTEVDQERWNRWGELIHASTLAIEPYSERKDSLEDEACLLSLVHNARQWLDACADRQPEASEAGQSQDTCLPRWLIDRLDQAEQHSPAHHSHNNAPPGQGELATPNADSSQLACAFPILIRRLLRLEDLERDFAGQLQHEKLLAMKELAYGAGHEINNPLANISSRAQTLLSSETDADRRRKLATINAQAFRAHEMIANMMLFAKPPALELGNVSLETLIDETIDQLKPIAQDQQTMIVREESASLPNLEADSVQLKVALASICTNSLEALGLGGQVRIGVDVDDSRQSVVVRIHDTGPGVSERARRHLFDPFFSGREAGRGLGFGLSKAWRIVNLHGGDITADDDTSAGATFRVRLPVRVPDKA